VSGEDPEWIVRTEIAICAGIARFRQLPGYLWGALGTVLGSANRGAVGNRYPTLFNCSGSEKRKLKIELLSIFHSSSISLPYCSMG